MRSFLKFWFPLGAYSAIIFFISSLPSQQLTFTQVVWDKALHVLEYAPLGFLAARALIFLRRWPMMTVWALSVAFCYLYGLSDEFHQSFVPERSCDWRDVLADSIGGIVGGSIYLAQYMKTKLRQR